jgi:hypothetical protein
MICIISSPSADDKDHPRHLALKPMTLMDTHFAGDPAFSVMGV